MPSCSKTRRTNPPSCDSPTQTSRSDGARSVLTAKLITLLRNALDAGVGESCDIPTPRVSDREAESRIPRTNQSRGFIRPRFARVRQTPLNRVMLTRPQNVSPWPFQRNMTPFDIRDCRHRNWASQSLAVGLHAIGQHPLRTAFCTQTN